MNATSRLVLVSIVGLLVVAFALAAAATFIYMREQAKLPPPTAPVPVTTQPAYRPDPRPSVDTAEAIATGGSILFVVLMILAAIMAVAVYVVPILVASWRKHPYLASIIVVNILLGWSFVGWTLSLAWAVSPIDVNKKYRF